MLKKSLGTYDKDLSLPSDSLATDGCSGDPNCREGAQEMPE